MAVPRTVGRTPRQRVPPALPPEMLEWSELPTSPTVARHARLMRRSSLDGMARPVALFFGLELGAGAAHELGAAAGVKLDVVDRRAVGTNSRGRALPTLMSALGPDRPVADLEALRRHDVALLAVRVVQQGDAGRAVRVVLDVRDSPAPVFVALEVDQTVAPLVAAALMARGDAAVVVAAALARDGLDERTLRFGRVTSSIVSVVMNDDPGTSASVS